MNWILINIIISFKKSFFFVAQIVKLQSWNNLEYLITIFIYWTTCIMDNKLFYFHSMLKKLEISYKLLTRKHFSKMCLCNIQAFHKYETQLRMCNFVWRTVWCIVLDNIFFVSDRICIILIKNPSCAGMASLRIFYLQKSKMAAIIYIVKNELCIREYP